MRAQGLVLLILGVILIALSFLLLGAPDIQAIIGALLLGVGGAAVVAALCLFTIKKPRMQ
ncbi:hypothetical protein [Corynebacterium pelargi]|uniref:Uncharacterized protein n=1 Tax=Corynebacterium pelargi TaxID=1471400 RepID=A0A410WAL7_9CORY|nr:hypothetical protein [Corynebacterium pelargi]QAU52979.1 hypothetical protein CPELA_08620 [Corynebacterium pelargi]GGG75617.1 hypothetical protein GCM10007338_11550 [Corynebacterium pelargi]